MPRTAIIALLAILVAGYASAEETVVTMGLLQKTGTGEKIGTIKAEDTRYGTLFTPDLRGLSTGLHGFHVHQNADCSAARKAGETVPGLAAGGHYAPKSSENHAGPYERNSHLGDLPALYVDAQGTSNHPVLAPRLEVSDLHGRSLMIHSGGDNYADQPQKLGGGGPRVACGVVE